MKVLCLPSCINPPRAALAASVFFLWLFGAAANPVQAGAVSAAITVRAVVLPVAAMKTIRQPATLTITEEDVRKGYVDEISPALIEIRTNTQRGCVLTLDAAEGPFKEVEVMFEGHTVVVGRQGGILILPAHGSRIVSMRYRFLLAHDTRPGAYPWPFSLSISPLE
jgi:hypothetical protein